MIKALPASLRFAIVSVIVALNVVLLCTVVYLLTVLKFLVPGKKGKLVISNWLSLVAELWIANNSRTWDFFYSVDWKIHIDPSLEREKTYCVISNHQSWVDIIVLQYVLTKKIPFIRFFIKSDLIWVPFLGVAWWALDFPFMKRYSASYLQKNPHKKGKDLEVARRSCEKFKLLPTSILIFAEGTRFTDKKHAQSKSSYKNLLPPKTGGFFTVLNSMGEQLDSILDVTIVYPNGRPSVIDLLMDRIPQIEFYVEKRKVPEEFLDTPPYPVVKKWTADLWQEKDSFLSGL